MSCLTEEHYVEEIIGDGLLGFLRDDPVRPLIPLTVRIADNKSAYVLFNDQDCCVDAVVCVFVRAMHSEKEGDVVETRALETPSVFARR